MKQKTYIQGLLFPISDNIKRIKLMCENAKNKRAEYGIYSVFIKDVIKK